MLVIENMKLLALQWKGGNVPEMLEYMGHAFVIGPGDTILLESPTGPISVRPGQWVVRKEAGGFTFAERACEVPHAIQS